MKHIISLFLVLGLLSPNAFSASDTEAELWPRQEVKAVTGNNLDLETVTDSKPVRINSRNYTQASGSSIAFQSKPAQTVTTTGSVIGGEISPRLNNDIDAANIIGLHVDSYLKGTASRDISGDVRGVQVELVTDDAGVTAVAGNVSAIRVRAAFSAAVTGVMSALRIEKVEAQTGTHQWDAVLELPSTNAGVWNDAPGTEPTTADGYIKVIINGNARYIQLYSGAPVD